MAEKAGCPVIPVTLIDTDQLLEARPGFDIRKAKVNPVNNRITDTIPKFLIPFSNQQKN